MRYELVIFDLDGTLLDTLEDLANATNQALSRAGFPPRSLEDVRRFIGNGVARLISLSVPEGTPDDLRQRVLADFRRGYAENVNALTRPYPGIPELLSELRGASIHAAVNSNKPDSAVQTLCDAHFGPLLSLAFGEREGVPKKPAPDGARRIMEQLNVSPGRTLYVGDGDTDILTAQNAGVDCAWVSWGYRKREELGDLAVPNAFDTVEALKRFILS